MKPCLKLLFIPFMFLLHSCNNETTEQPNVLLIITDDQGYGDLGFHGNHHIKTPVIDSFAQNSIRFSNFYVSPVCAPTRSSLMTGRFSLRTGVRDTYNGGAIMASSEVTIAEMLKKEGYRTGIFGKWHLGDNYPSRPMDQGFDESVIHLSGGMGQVGDFTTWFRRDSSYFDPLLWHNGRRESYAGYCSDIFASQAIHFIRKNKNNPFFCYLSFNAPHTPLQVPDKYYQIYKDIDPAAGFDKAMLPEMSEKDKEDARKVYAMVTNIDDNLKMVFKALKETGLDRKTIVIFMTDNGPQQARYVGGFRGRKGSVYEGGVRVPFFMSIPGMSDTGITIPSTAAHIDVLPTVAELCKAEIPKDRIIDGRSLLALVNDTQVDYNNRPLFLYWTRKFPEKYNNIAVLKDNYKLVGNAGYNADIKEFELYDLSNSPDERESIILSDASHSQEMKLQLDKLYDELTSEYNLINQPPIIIGSKEENPVVLNRNDASGERGIWNQENIFGYWNVRIEPGIYDVTFKFTEPVPKGGIMHLELSPRIYKNYNPDSTDLIVFKDLMLKGQSNKLLPFYTINKTRYFPFWVELKKVK